MGAVTLGHYWQPDLTMLSLTLFTLSLATTMVPTMSQFTCQGVGYYPHPADCSQFYRCTDLWSTGQYQQYLFQCAAGTVWDQEIGVCNWPQAVKGCGAEDVESSTITTITTTPTTSTSTMTTTITTTPTITTNTPPETTFNPPETTTNPPETTATPPETTPMYTPSDNSVFKCEEPGVVDDQEHCNKFWLCKQEPEGSRVLESLLYRCPSGYIFSSSILRCKKEKDITCVNKLEGRNINTIQLTVEMMDSFFDKWVVGRV